MIALSITILELKEFGKEFAKQIVSNSNAIAKAFADLGYEVRKANTGNYSENHQVHVFIDKIGDHLKLYKGLMDNSISTNFEGTELTNHRYYIRIGTQEITRRGMKEVEMIQIASLVDRSLKGENVKNEVVEFNKKFPNIVYSFDKR